MTDSLAPTRTEPEIHKASPLAGPSADPQGVPAAYRAVESPPPSAPTATDQLARIEDKAARIEEKYARSEALLARVEDKIEAATARMSDSARQADVAAIRSELRAVSERTRRLPGAGALVVTAVVTAILTAVLIVAAQRYNLAAMLPVTPR